MIVSYFYLISLPDKKQVVRQRLKKALLSVPLDLVLLDVALFVFCCTLICFGVFSAERLDGGLSACLGVTGSLFLLIHAVDVGHGIQTALHSRVTKHSDYQHLLHLYL